MQLPFAGNESETSLKTFSSITDVLVSEKNYDKYQEIFGFGEYSLNGFNAFRDLFLKLSVDEDAFNTFFEDCWNSYIRDHAEISAHELYLKSKELYMNFKRIPMLEGMINNEYNLDIEEVVDMLKDGRKYISRELCFEVTEFLFLIDGENLLEVCPEFYDKYSLAKKKRNNQMIEHKKWTLGVAKKIFKLSPEMIKQMGNMGLDVDRMLDKEISDVNINSAPDNPFSGGNADNLLQDLLKDFGQDDNKK